MRAYFRGQYLGRSRTCGMVKVDGDVQREDFLVEKGTRVCRWRNSDHREASGAGPATRPRPRFFHLSSLGRLSTSSHQRFRRGKADHFGPEADRWISAESALSQATAPGCAPSPAAWFAVETRPSRPGAAAADPCRIPGCRRRSA